MKRRKKKSTPSVRTVESANEAQVVLWDLPRKLLQNKDNAHLKAAGIFMAEQMLVEFRDQSPGRIAFSLRGWTKKKTIWEIPEIKPFMEGFLWGQEPYDGSLTAYHSQRVTDLLAREDQHPELPDIFGIYNLMALIYELEQHEEEGKQTFSKTAAQSRLDDIHEGEIKDATVRHISNLELLHMILRSITPPGSDTFNNPYALIDPVKGPCVSYDTKHRKILPFFKTADLAMQFKETLNMIDMTDPQPKILAEQELYEEFSCARFAGIEGVDVWLDPQHRYSLMQFHKDPTTQA